MLFIDRSSDLRDFFFIKFPFPRVCPSGTNDADIIAAFGVDDNEQFVAERLTHRDETWFGSRMFWVRNGQRPRIAEDGGSPFESDTVFREIGSRFARVPFEGEWH